MQKSRHDNFEFILYLMVGVISVGFAFYLSTAFLVKGRTQTSAAAPQNSDAKSKMPMIDEALLKRISEDPDLLKKSLSDYAYDPKGKRDPFMPFYGGESITPGDLVGPVTTLQRYDLDRLRLIGIIWDISRPRAMVLDPTGNVHVIEVNAKMGRNNAYVAAIREGEIVVVEPFEDGEKKSYTTKVLAIGKAD